VTIPAGKIIYLNEFLLLSENWPRLNHNYEIIPSKILALTDCSLSKSFIRRSAHDLDILCAKLAEDIDDVKWNQFYESQFPDCPIYDPRSWLVPLTSPPAQTINWLISRAISAASIQRENGLCIFMTEQSTTFDFSANSHKLDPTYSRVHLSSLETLINQGACSLCNSDYFKLLCVSLGEKSFLSKYTPWTNAGTHPVCKIGTWLGEFISESFPSIPSDLPKALAEMVKARNNSALNSRVQFTAELIKVIPMLNNLQARLKLRTISLIFESLLPRLSLPLKTEEMSDLKELTW
jgi:hypothetical protein